jgi:glyoxylase-like metal-dependent hydrolase (beta-lactamase superfamily II)
MQSRPAIALALVCALPPLVHGAVAVRPAPERIDVAPGVHVFITLPYGDVGLDGNSVAIVGDDGVVVFDSNGTPAASAAVLQEIRTITSAPVRYVVNSHWHWDHWYGTETYRNAFPDVHVVAHEKTREMMRGPAIEFNRPGLETLLPRYIASLEKRAAADPTLQPLLDEDRFFLDQKSRAKLVMPDLTYSSQMNLFVGGREVQVRHDDRAVTPGDTFIYLPKEKVLLTGDLLVNPIAFALSCYPSGWLATLERIDALDATTIVPGHGKPLHDKTLLHAHMEAMRILLDAGKSAKARGLDPDQARDEAMPRLHDVMVTMTGNDPKRNQEFKIYLADWYMHRVYDELNGALTDAIAAIPAK